MIMKKISKTKHLLLLILVLISGLLTSCTNKYEVMEDGVTITVSKELQKYMVQTTLPTLHFDYDNVRVMSEADGSAYFFVQNDQYQLSEHFAAHLSRYSQDQIFIVAESDQKYDNGKAKFDGKDLPLDEVIENGTEQKYSKEYQIVTVNDDGTRYSYQFRTFVSNQKRYFIYRYTSNIGISLEQSLMVISGEKENRLVLVPLPYDTTYQVSPVNIELKSLIHKDTYTDERYNKYPYPNALKDLSETEIKAKITDWYIKYCCGEVISDELFISYYGVKFKVIFGIENAGNEQNKKGFQLVYLG